MFDGDACVTAGLFGLLAAGLLYGAEQTQQVQQAVGDREVIGQAKGILMERFTVSGDEASQMLITSSQGTNVEIGEIAAWVIAEADKQREHPGQPATDL